MIADYKTYSSGHSKKAQNMGKELMEQQKTKLDIYLSDFLLADYKTSHKIKQIFSKERHSNYILFDVDTGDSRNDTESLMEILTMQFEIPLSEMNILQNTYGNYYIFIHFNQLVRNEKLIAFGDRVFEVAGMENLSMIPSQKGEKIDTNTQAVFVDKINLRPIKGEINEEVEEVKAINSDKLVRHLAFPITVEEQTDIEIQAIADDKEMPNQVLKVVKNMLKVKLLSPDYTTDDSIVKMAKYLKKQGYTIPHAVRKITQVLNRTALELPDLLEVSRYQITHITHELVNKVYEDAVEETESGLVDISLIWSKDEINNVLAVSKKHHLKKLYYILMKHSKIHGNRSTGRFFMTYEQMFEQGANRNRSELLEQIEELKNSNYIEIVNRGVWDSGNMKYKPNEYKIIKNDVPQITNKHIELAGGKRINFDNWLWKLHANKNVHLKKDKVLSKNKYHADIKKYLK